MIKFLKDKTVYRRLAKGCGDGCCTWFEWEYDFVQIGEEYEEDEIELNGLIEGEDFIRVT
jgi:hypothetical protein